MWTLEQAMLAAISKRLGGDWWHEVSRPSQEGYKEAGAAIEAVQADLVASFARGDVVAYAHAVGSDMFYSVPSELWQKVGADSYLTGTLNGYFTDDLVPKALVGLPIFVRDRDAQVWIGSTKAEKPRRGPKLVFDSGSFETEAVRRLWEIGGFTEGWTKADLVKEMEGWCGENWERTPGKTWAYDHIGMAEQRFLAEKSAI